MDNVTRKLMKLLRLDADQIYHVFCLALCLVWSDGEVNEAEGETLMRLGYGLGLSAEDIIALRDNAIGAIKDTSSADVIAFSLTKLKSSLDADQWGGVKQILRYVAGSDRTYDTAETALLNLMTEIMED